VYGRQSAGQKLDILYPSGSGPARPAVLYIHGGGWNGGDKGDDPDMMMDMLRGFACDGFVAASINYRLDTEGRFPAAVEDCTLAVRWLRAHAAAYGVDKTRIGLVGGSAGGYLAAMLAVTAGTREFEGSGGYAEESSAVQAVASVSGPMDLQVNLCAANPEDSHKMVSNFLGVPLTENLVLARRASPIAYVRRDTPPTLFVHCKEDPAIDVDQSLRMADALARAGASTNLIVLDGKNHGSDMARTEPVLSELREFFRQVLKPDV
jgi:acetyl esterase/lipase